MHLPPPGTVPVSEVHSVWANTAWGAQGQRHNSPLIHSHIESRCVGVSAHKYCPGVYVGSWGCWVLLLHSLRYNLYCLETHPNLVRGSCEILSLVLPTLHCSPLLHGFLLVLRELEWAHGSSWSLDPGYTGHTHLWMQ